MKRVKPLAGICPVYDSDESELPETVRVPMSDGKILTYRLDNADAANQYGKAMNVIIRKWVAEDEQIGYQYKPRHEQKESRRGKFLRLMGLGQ